MLVHLSAAAFIIKAKPSLIMGSPQPVSVLGRFPADADIVLKMCGVAGVKVSIVALQAVDPGSIPGRRNFLSGQEREKFGGAGYRSPCLSHAKRALYHVSYTPELYVGQG